jgi:outer membrane protein OmpA-like peptidoglycan-associated protein
MKMKNRGVILTLLAFALTASLGLSQTSGSGSGNGSVNVGGNGSGAASNSGAVANITTNSVTNSTNRPQFIQALPGSSDPTFPGYAQRNDSCHLLYLPSLRHLTMNEVRSMAKGNKLDKHQMHVDVVDAKAIAPNDDPIEIVPYWVDAIAWPDDRTLASVVIPGKYLHTEEELLGVALLKAKEISHARRYSIKVCPVLVSHTSSHGGGIGAAGADVPGTGSTGQAFSLGFSFGANNASQQEHEIIEVSALNDGPVDPPAVQKQPDLPQAPAPTTPPPQPVAPPPVQTVRIEVAVVPQAPQPPAPPPAPAPTASAAPPDTCDLPQFVVHFDFDKSIVHDEELAGIKSIAAWLLSHPSCRVQVEGHASAEASFDYNAALGRRRSKAVYDLLIAAGAKEQVVQFASLSKDFPASEHLPENRRVILRVIGAASGK